MKPAFFLLLVALMVPEHTKAQAARMEGWSWDGTLVVGYVNDGAFVNCTGPNVQLNWKQQRLLLGMLPSLRIKSDDAVPRNSLVTPSLGVGVTYSWGLWAMQLPMYYQPKTATANGGWHLGLGLGVKINAIKK